MNAQDIHRLQNEISAERQAAAHRASYAEFRVSMSVVRDEQFDQAQVKGMVETLQAAQRDAQLVAALEQALKALDTAGGLLPQSGADDG